MKIIKRRQMESIIDFIRRVMHYADTCEEGYTLIEWKPSYYEATQAQID
jgi:hypothetical protein